MRRNHLPVEQKGDVSVEFFLQFMQPLVRAIPRSRFVHREDDLIGLLVEREKIDDAGLLNSAGRRVADRTC